MNVDQVLRSETRSLATLRLADADSGFENPRQYSGLEDEKVRELAINIYQRWLLNPLLVTEDGLVIGGGRRFRALSLLRDWIERDEAPAETSNAESQFGPPAFVLRISDLILNVPVRVIAGYNSRHTIARAPGHDPIEGIALADNLHREDLSTYEVACKLAALHEAGATGVELARLIGKGPPYVSRKLSTWRRACPELRAAWRDGMTEEAVIALCELPPEEQIKVIAGPVPRGRRGPAGRPSVDMVRDFLLAIEKPEVVADDYIEGVRDAIRWATGEKTSPIFAQLAKELGA